LPITTEVMHNRNINRSETSAKRSSLMIQTVNERSLRRPMIIKLISSISTTNDSSLVSNKTETCQVVINHLVLTGLTWSTRCSTRSRLKKGFIRRQVRKSNTRVWRTMKASRI